MKQSIVLLLIAVGLLGCNYGKDGGKASDKVDNNTTAAVQSQSPAATSGAVNNLEEILGSYVGAFGDNKITLLVTKAGDGAISGRSIVGGNDRPFDGTLSFDNGVYVIEAREPGDHKDDGIFKFQIAQSNLDEVKGTWKANDTKRPEKSFTLERKKFEYRTNVGEYPKASQRLLKASDVENLAKEELQLMRNEIFARHGYCFAKKDLRQQFEMEAWYVPNTVDIKGYLTEIEKKNIALIKRYEKYADEYGDEYGR